eukprot:2469128-Rhodomonas_salina.1
MPHAVEKLRYWLAHPGIYARDLSSERMADVWRVALGQLQMKLSSSDAREVPHVALEVCRSRGWVSGEVDERNHQGETALMQLCALRSTAGVRSILHPVCVRVCSRGTPEGVSVSVSVSVSVCVCLCACAGIILPSLGLIAVVVCAGRRVGSPRPSAATAERPTLTQTRTRTQTQTLTDTQTRRHRHADGGGAADLHHRRCWQAGADVNATREGDGVTALMLAAAGGMHACLGVLLAAGARADARDASPFTFQALHFAAVNGHAQAILALVRGGGARIGGRDRQARTALHWAAERGHAAAIRALVEGGAEVDAVNQWRYTPLHRAAYEGHAGAVRELLAARAAVKAEDEHLRTPLLKAAQRAREEVCVLLLAAGADAGARDEEGKTSLELAAQAGGAATLLSLLRVA